MPKTEMNATRRRLLDVSIGAFLVFAAVWIYELANYAALSAFGSQASLVVSGVLPIGVSASVPDAGLLMLAKPAQIGLSVVAMLGLFLAVRSMKFPLASNVAVTSISIYLASAYWELLSSVGSISYDAHLAIFALLAIGAQTGMSTLFRT